MQKLLSVGEYYSFNPHATDNRGYKNTTRRLMFGWVYPSQRLEAQAYSSIAQLQHVVPYWVGANSLARYVSASIQPTRS